LSARVGMERLSWFGHLAGWLPRAGWKWLALALAIREAFSFWTGHPYDLESWIRTGYVVAHGENPYSSFWPAVPGVSIAFLNQPLPSAAYLPFWPLVFGGSYRLWEGLGGGDRFVLYFLLKQGPIAGDLVTGALIFLVVRRATGAEAPALAALAFWSLFPYDIAISAVWGQLDSVTVALLLALLLVPPKGTARRAVLYGVGIFVKWIAVSFLPFEFFRSRGWRRLGPLAAAGLVVGLTAGVMVPLGWSFGTVSATGTSQAHGGGFGMNFAFALGFGPLPYVFAAVPGFYTYLGYVWVPAVALAGSAASRWVRSESIESELRALGFVLTILLLTRWGTYEQYMLYPFALLIVDVTAFHPGRRRFLWFFIAVTSAFLLANNDLAVRFVTPVIPAAWTYSQAVDGSPFWGTFRLYTLLVLTLIAGITLVQLAWTFWKDDPAPVPWLLRWRRTPGPVAPTEVARG
jgi:hypothetical protein